MKKFALLFMVSFLLGLILIACGQSDTNTSAKAIEGYIQALVAQDATQVINLSCADWEDDAQIELDSLTAVSAAVENLSCQETGKDSSDALVECTGKIVFDYNGEKQELDVAGRGFVARQEDGIWRMCGYR
jgi:hypothetical protein